MKGLRGGRALFPTPRGEQKKKVSWTDLHKTPCFQCKMILRHTGRNPCTSQFCLWGQTNQFHEMKLIGLLSQTTRAAQANSIDFSAFALVGCFSRHRKSASEACLIRASSLFLLLVLLHSAPFNGLRVCGVRFRFKI